MSAFQCSTAHLNALLHAVRYLPRMQSCSTDLRIVHGGELHSLGGWNEDETWARAGLILADENARSVGCRYREAPADHGYVYVDPFGARPLTAAAALKACACYEYQACETPDWPETFAHALLERCRKELIACLPGYEDGPWDLADPRFEPGAVA